MKSLRVFEILLFIIAVLFKIGSSARPISGEQKVISCDPAELPSHKDDETDVSWDCPNGHGHGAVCTKTCNDGTLAGSKSEKTCQCKSRCQWKGPVGSCKRAYCVKAESFRGSYQGHWPKSVTCTNADGSIDFGVYNEWTEYPVGTVCSQKCKKYQKIMQGTYTADEDASHCECSNGRCAFNNRDIGYCQNQVCSTSMPELLDEFELGYEHPEATSDGFVPYLVDCNDTVPDDWENQSIAGFAVLGSHCYLKCKEGYRFADDDQQYLDDQNRRIIKCTKRYDYYMDPMITWDIYSESGYYAYHDDCNYYGDCHYYPQCIPDN